MKFQKRIVILTISIVLISCLVFLLLVLHLPSTVEENITKFLSISEESAVANNETEKNSRVVEEVLASHQIGWSRRSLMGRSPWSVAARWVRPRQVHPNDASEIGL